MIHWEQISFCEILKELIVGNVHVLKYQLPEMYTKVKVIFK